MGAPAAKPPSPQASSPTKRAPEGACRLLEDNRRQVALLAAQKRFEETKAARDSALRDLGVDPASLEQQLTQLLSPPTTTKESQHGAQA